MPVESATGRRRRAPRGGGSGWPGRCRRARCARGRPRRRASYAGARHVGPEDERPRARVAARDDVAIGTGRPRRRAVRPVGEPGMDVVETAGQAARIAVERPTTEPGVAGPAVPGDDPVVQRQPQERQVLVRRPRSRGGVRARPEVVAEEPDQPAEEAWGVGGHDHRAIKASHQAAGDRERVGPAAGASRTATGSAVRYVQRALRPGLALSRRARPGQVEEGLGDVDRTHRREPVGQAPEPEGRLVTGRGDHGRMIRPPVGTSPSSARAAASIARCARETSASSSDGADPGHTTPSPMSRASVSATRRSSTATGRWTSGAARCAPASPWSCPTTATVVRAGLRGLPSAQRQRRADGTRVDPRGRPARRRRRR